MKKSLVSIIIFCIIIIGVESCNKNKIVSFEDNDEVLSGGSQTVFDASGGAYSHSFANMSNRLSAVHGVGDAQFEKTFVSAPAPINGGLGPLYNNVSCVSCHVGDGRGKVPGTGEDVASILFRVSETGVNTHGGPLPIKNFGDQIQNRSTINTIKEADVLITYSEQLGQFNDGTNYTLRKPLYTIQNAYKNFPSGVMLSPRVASPVFGLGLLEAISDKDIIANEDELDMNGDEISGKANYVWNVVENKMTLGRFGWKANQPSILQQVAGAYNGDMGITTFIFPKENSEGQIQYDFLNDDYELSDSLLHATSFYIQSLAVPARRNVINENVKMGKQLFLNAGCDACHISSWKTSVNVAFPSLSNQKIHPYTDLLLHDMGDGLSDQRPDYKATGNEWRTPPLWGIGLTQKVNGHTNFLHDGRARNLMEAILWHDGEAKNSKEKVKAFTSKERTNLILFLESL